jgi:hypothetical protein
VTDMDPRIKAIIMVLDPSAITGEGYGEGARQQALEDATSAAEEILKALADPSLGRERLVQLGEVTDWLRDHSFHVEEETEYLCLHTAYATELDDAADALDDVFINGEIQARMRVDVKVFSGATHQTPWGLAQSLDREAVEAIGDGRRDVTWAERWVIARDMAEDGGADPGEAAMIATAETMDHRAATAHERVACSACRAPLGAPCSALPWGYEDRPSGGALVRKGRPLRHSHAARLFADGISPR